MSELSEHPADGSGKTCCTCHRVMPLAMFNKRRAAKDGLQARCRDCAAEWYRQNRDEHRRNVAARNAEVADRNRRQMIAYLQEHPCVDCGESDIRVLDFDHRDPAQKKALVTTLVRWALTWERVLEEIEKCDVRCANCHRLRTARMSGWARHLVQQATDAAVRASSRARLAALVAPAASSVAPLRVADGVWRASTG